MTDYVFVKDRPGDPAPGSNLIDIACAMNPSGSKVYVAERPPGLDLGRIVSMDWPNLDNEVEVYGDPTGYRICGVSCTPSGIKIVLASTSTGIIEVREADETIIWTSPVAGVSTTGGAAVWNPTDNRLYVLFRRNGSPRVEIYSMDEDGSNVVTELDMINQGPVLPPRLIVTSDGAIWWVGAPSGPGNPRPYRWTAADGQDIGGSGTPFAWSVVTEPNTLVDVLTTIGSPYNTRQYKFESGVVAIDSGATPTITPPDFFDGYRIVNGATNSDFTRGVAFGYEDDGTVEETRWWTFEGAPTEIPWLRQRQRDDQRVAFSQPGNGPRSKQRSIRQGWGSWNNYF